MKSPSAGADYFSSLLEPFDAETVAALEADYLAAVSVARGQRPSRTTVEWLTADATLAAKLPEPMPVDKLAASSTSVASLEVLTTSQPTQPSTRRR